MQHYHSSKLLLLLLSHSLQYEYVKRSTSIDLLIHHHPFPIMSCTTTTNNTTNKTNVIHTAPVDLNTLLQQQAQPQQLLTTETTTGTTATCILDCHCELGEGILYDDQHSVVMWTDILQSKFYMLQLDSSSSTSSSSSSQSGGAVHIIYQLPKQMCSFGMLVEQESTTTTTTTTEEKKLLPRPLLCAWHDGFQIVHIGDNNRPWSTMSSGDEDVNPVKGPTRLNDGRVDPTGQWFVCGGYYGEMEHGTSENESICSRGLTTTTRTTTSTSREGRRQQQR